MSPLIEFVLLFTDKNIADVALFVKLKIYDFCAYCTKVYVSLCSMSIKMHKNKLEDGC